MRFGKAKLNLSFHSNYDLINVRIAFVSYSDYSFENLLAKGTGHSRNMALDEVITDSGDRSQRVKRQGNIS
jgi:hypothetical protein